MPELTLYGPELVNGPEDFDRYIVKDFFGSVNERLICVTIRYRKIYIQKRKLSAYIETIYQERRSL